MLRAVRLMHFLCSERKEEKSADLIYGIEEEVVVIHGRGRLVDKPSYL